MKRLRSFFRWLSGRREPCGEDRQLLQVLESQTRNLYRTQGKSIQKMEEANKSTEELRRVVRESVDSAVASWDDAGRVNRKGGIPS